MAKKLYYKIGEACKILEIQPYVLRYWETEFPFLSPNKSKSGQRVYGEPELTVIRRIKELLYQEGYTIAGAKKKLELELANPGGVSPSQNSSSDPSSGEENGKDRSGASTKVDTASAKKVKILRSGVERALDQAREILGILSPTQ